MNAVHAGTGPRSVRWKLVDHSPRIVALSSLVAVLALAASAHGEPALRLSMPDAQARARRHAPELVLPRAALRSSAQLHDAAGAALARPPRVDASVGPRWRSDVNEWGIDATVGVWQDLSLGGLGRARRAYATAFERQARAELERTALEAATQAGLLWVDARFATELLKIRQQALDDAGELQRIARARVEAGRSPPSEQALANALVGGARAGVLEARGRLSVALTELRALIGLDPETTVVVVGELDAAGAATRVGSAGLAPDIAASRAAALSSSSAAELERAAGRSFLSLGSSLSREGTGDYIVLGRVELPLPFVNPAAFAAVRQDAEARIAQARVQQIGAQIERDVRLAAEERRHARELRDSLAQEVVAPARAALEQARREYQVGKGELAAVLAARRELLGTLERFTEAAAVVRRADLRLERLLGGAPDTGRAVAGKPRRREGR